MFVNNTICFILFREIDERDEFGNGKIIFKFRWLFRNILNILFYFSSYNVKEIEPYIEFKELKNV